MRRVLVVTGTRAEYGLMRPLLALLRDDPNADLRLVASAAHLSPEFGLTKTSITDDGYVIADEVEMLLSGDTPSAIAKSVGLGTIGFADVFRRHQPDVIVLLGDRYEVLSAAQAALFARIPVAHLHGGEVTEGASDEAIRHSVTKMSHFHFVSTDDHARRVIQLGESPDRIFMVGAIGLDSVTGFTPYSRGELEERYSIAVDRPILLATYHPETLGEQDSHDVFQSLLAVLSERSDTTIVITYPNADSGGRALFGMIEEFVSTHLNAVARVNFGQQAYLSVLAHADAVIGNSSSGIIEAPSFGVPVVNIGDRQLGRVKAACVIDCASDRASIKAALTKALNPSFKKEIRQAENPYGDGKTAPRIHEIIMAVPLAGATKKSFHDLAVT